MCRSHGIRAALVVSALVAAVTHANRIVAATTEPADLAIQQAIDQLGADDQSIRNLAENDLISAGKPAIKALQLAAVDPRPEVAGRARRALRSIRLFMLRGVPDEALSTAQAYLSGDDFDQRKPQLNRLFQMQPQPNAVLTRLIPLEQDEDLRRQMLYQLGNCAYRPTIPRMLVNDDDLPGVLNVLNSSAEMWGRAEAADDAMVLYLSGQLDQQISICTAEQINGDSVSQDRAAAQLCYLYRVCGKYDQALRFARLSRDQSLIFLVLQDEGDWSAAVTEPDERWRDPITAGGYRAAFQRLAGHPDAALDIMNGLSSNAPNDSDSSFSPSRIFLLNDLPERGIELLTDQHPAIAFQMRLARGEISQALEIADKYATHPRDADELAQLRLALRQSLGELTAPPAESPPTTRETSQTENAWQEAVDDLDEKKYTDAADAFGEMWAADETHFDRLYLQGYALQMAGQNDRGKQLMQKAQMLPLGDPLARWQFATQLQAAGLSDAAEEQRNLGLRSGADFDEVGFSEIYNTRFEMALDHKQWHTAADALDRLCLINLSPLVQWHDPVRLLTIPAMAHLVKAREACDRRDLTTVMRELQIYQQYLPASSEMVLEMVPALDDLGEHAHADETFNSVYEKLSAICRQYPKSVTYQNQLAWMCACCGRRLDEALAASQTAVRLQPNDWQVLDTLAEVKFRRGDRAAAIDLEKHAMSMTSDAYIARQVKRFESAAIPSTTQPGVAPE